MTVPTKEVIMKAVQKQRRKERTNKKGGRTIKNVSLNALKKVPSYVLAPPDYLDTGDSMEDRFFRGFSIPQLFHCENSTPLFVISSRQLSFSVYTR